MIERTIDFTLTPLRMSGDVELSKIVRIALAVLALTVWIPFTLLGLGLLSVRKVELPLPPVPVKESVELEEDKEGKFWEDCFANHEHAIPIILTAQLGDDEKAELLVQLVRGAADDIDLVHSVIKQLNIVTFKKGRGFPTKADGSCGFHALLGESVAGVYQCDAKARRVEFTNWLKERRENLPSPIRMQLEEYHQRFDLLERVAPALADTIRPFLQLSEEEFVGTAEVQDAYFEYLQATTTWLTNFELEAAAICFQKTVVLRYPIPPSMNEYAESILNPDADETVLICYNGYNHYERGEL